MTQARLVGKIIAEGRLKLQSPLLIGSGREDSGNDVDTQVLKDRNAIPFIPGTSMAGVLRAFLERKSPQEAEILFGSSDAGAKNSCQSALVFHDIPLEKAVLMTRDGVSIHPATGTAMKGHKFDYEAVERGAEGLFRMEITLRQSHLSEDGKLRAELQSAIDALLKKIAAGFQVGAHTGTGFGQVRVEKLEKRVYDFHDRNAVAAWLLPEGNSVSVPKESIRGDEVPCLEDDFVVEAEFALTHSLIVRDYDVEEAAEKSEGMMTVSACSLKDKDSYVIPGSSWKGVLRHHAEYILGRLEKPQGLVSWMMGPSPQETKAQPENKWKGRFQVRESLIRPERVTAKPQARVRIDRFTGGTIDSALFASKPLWRKDAEAAVKLCFVLEHAEEHEAGLALCLLKDLWLGKVAVGGEKSIGRGVLQGMRAMIRYHGNTYRLEEGESADEKTIHDLNHLVERLTTWQEKGAEA